MTKRLESRQYVFSVEGETEYWYLKWLQNQINNCPNRKYNALIKPWVDKSPRHFSKRLTAKTTPHIIHLCDIEGNEQENIVNFNNILTEMKNVRVQKGIYYILGYSNFTFELWIILHKIDCSASLDCRRNYLEFIRRAFGENFENLNHYKQEDNFKKCLKQITIDDVRSAICRAERIMTINNKNGKILNKFEGYVYYLDNPALSVHEIVKKILLECGVM